MLRYSVALLALMLTACPDDGEAESGDTGDTHSHDTEHDTEHGSGDDTGTGGSIDVPTAAAAMATWLSAESYSGWAAESAIHDGVGNSPHGRVQVYFNEALTASFDAGNTTHTVGSASVKELYDAMDNRTGWAVMVKIADNDTPESWYWYLDAAGSVMDGNGLGGCDGCHSAGTDRVTTVYPLQ